MKFVLLDGTIREVIYKELRFLLSFSAHARVSRRRCESEVEEPSQNLVELVGIAAHPHVDTA